MKRLLPHAVVLTAIAMLVAVAFAVPALGGGAQVTSGDLTEFALGPSLGYTDVTGRVQMVRTGDGKTIVSVQVAGLRPGLTYGSHVHLQSCAAGDAGVHYSFGYPVVGGAGPGPNSEIWPGPFTANAAGHANGKAMVGEHAGNTAVSVVIHAPAPGGQKIACADLS
ncbi:MAG: hypothetical protein WD895_10275 [Acidimicrobiia bacterium]